MSAEDPTVCFQVNAAPAHDSEGVKFGALENRLAGQQAKHKENDKHNDENNEQYTRDPPGGRRYAGEPKDTGDNGYHEKEECQSQHMRSPEKFMGPLNRPYARLNSEVARRFRATSFFFGRRVISAREKFPPRVRRKA
jgi:hypothetical protein